MDEEVFCIQEIVLKPGPRRRPILTADRLLDEVLLMRNYPNLMSFAIAGIFSNITGKYRLQLQRRYSPGSDVCKEAAKLTGLHLHSVRVWPSFLTSKPSSGKVGR